MGWMTSSLKEKLDETFSSHNIGGLFVTNSRVYKVAEFLAERGSMNVRLVGYDLLAGKYGISETGLYRFSDFPET